MDIDFSFMEEDEVFDMEPLDERTDLFPVRSVDGVFADPAGNIDLSEARDRLISERVTQTFDERKDELIGPAGPAGPVGPAGEPGIQGLRGEQGLPGKDGRTPEKGKDYFDGKDGDSVTVSNVSESTEDGGSNIVTFSDGKTLTVKNGSKGGKGDKGDPGDTPVREVDYWTEEDKTEIVNEVLEQTPQEVMIVNITSTTTGGVTTYSTDKTSQEIYMAAVRDRKLVFARYGNAFLPFCKMLGSNVGVMTTFCGCRAENIFVIVSIVHSTVQVTERRLVEADALTKGTYLVGNGDGNTVVLKTPEEVLEDIGAQPAGDYITADDIPQEVMIVNITGTTTDGKTTYTADKTALDVYNAYNEGKLVFATIGSTFFSLVGFPMLAQVVQAAFTGFIGNRAGATYLISTNRGTNANMQVTRTENLFASKDEATQETAGLMSPDDKVKLDGIDESKFVPVFKQNDNAYVELLPDVSNELNPFLDIKAAVNNEMGALLLGRSMALLSTESFDDGIGLINMAPNFFSVETVDPDNCGGFLTMDGDSLVYNADEGISGNVVMGCGCGAAGENNVAFGRESFSEGFCAAVFGNENLAVDLGLSAGQGNEALDASIAVGYFNLAAGGASAAFGFENSAGEFASFASGFQNSASNFGAAVFGKCNKFMEGGAEVAVSEGDAFIVGNGVGTDMEERSNAFRVTYSGEVFGKAAYNASGADYAEFFEWLDGNAEAEDRIGRFVTMDGNKIKIADRGDYILGIVSGNPCLVGNSDEEWQGRWERDEYNRFIQEEFDAPVTERKIVEELVLDEEGNKIPLIRTGRKRVEIPVLDENGEPTGETRTGLQKVSTPVLDEDGNQKYRTKRKVVFEETGDTVKAKRFKQNPAYDGNRSYTARRLRKEWDYIGMLGVLAVRDDGTCKVNGFCKVAAAGIATAAEKYIPGETYRVIGRVNENIVKVVFR